MSKKSVGSIKKYKKLYFIFAVILLFSATFLLLFKNESVRTSIRKNFFKATTVATGTTGTCNWTLDSDGLLLIEPTNGVSGTMGTYSSTDTFYIYKSQITAIRFNGIVYAPVSCYMLFSGFNQLTSFDGTNFNTQNATDMNRMFYECKMLTELDVSTFNTQNVTDMSC